MKVIETYVIESRSELHPEWSQDGLGENEPRTYEECFNGVESLREMGGEWVEAEYRIVDIHDGAIVVEWAGGQ